jgi:hypothetical protein
MPVASGDMKSRPASNKSLKHIKYLSGAKPTSSHITKALYNKLLNKAKPTVIAAMKSRMTLHTMIKITPGGLIST